MNQVIKVQYEDGIYTIDAVDVPQIKALPPSADRGAKLRELGTRIGHPDDIEPDIEIITSNIVNCEDACWRDLYEHAQYILDR